MSRQTDHAAPSGTTPIRLAVLASTLAIGGAEQLLKDLLSGLDPATFAPRLLVAKSDPGPVGREINALGIPMETGLLRSRLDPAGPLRVFQALRRSRAEALLMVNHLDCLCHGVPAALLAGVPVVNWHNETGRRYRPHAPVMLLRRLLLSAVDVVVAAARGHAEYVAQAEGVGPNRLRVVYNGVDPARVASDRNRDEARAALGLGREAAVAVQVAALRPDKAHHLMLKAFVRVVAAHPGAVLLVVGDGPLRADLEGLASALGLGQACRFLGARRDIGRVLAAADVAVLSSDPVQETLSVAAIEAMFAELPVVCTDVGSMREIVIDGETGLLVPPGSMERLSDAVLALLSDPARRAAMGRRGAEMALDRCHVRTMVRGFEAIFGELAGKRRQRRTR